MKASHRPPARRAQLPLLLWAVFERASKIWHGVRVTPTTIRQLALMRQHLLEPPRSITPKSKKQPTADWTAVSLVVETIRGVHTRSPLFEMADTRAQVSVAIRAVSQNS